MNLAQMIAAAKKAIEDGNLEEAKRLTASIKALKELESIAGTAETPAEVETLRAEVKSLQAFKARIEAEPPTNNNGVVVVEDEADKAKRLNAWKSLGDQLLGIKNAYLMPHAMDIRLKSEGQKAVMGANEGQSSEGGFLLQQDFSSEIMKHAHEQAVIMNRVRRVPIGPNSNGLKMNAVDETSRANGSRFGGIRGYWLAEAMTKISSQPKFRQMEWTLHKLGVLMYATDELLQDTTALGSIMEQGASEEVSFLVDDSIFNGTGVGMPVGIMNSPAKIAITPEAGQVATELLPENVFKMWSRMWGRSRLNALWFINQDLEPAMFGMKFPVGTGGQPVYLPPGGLSASPYATLMGRPVIPTEFNSTLGTEGDIMFVDPNQYLMIDKGGLQYATSIHVQFITDQTAFRWVYRVDGKSLWSSPLTPYKGTTTLTPFVTLGTR